MNWQEFLSLFDNKWLFGLLMSAGGIVVTLIVQQLMKRRIVLSYFVNHQKIGITTDDRVLGSVRITWNDREVQHLCLSTLELVNESFSDCEDMKATIYTNDTKLLSEKPR